MIEKIKLSHFQAHKDTELVLGNVTILRGPTDNGKSSVVRALNAFFNCNIKPDYAFHGEYPVSITLTSNGEDVTMSRNSKATTYTLGNKEFSKTGKKCPDEIKDFLGIKEYAIDTDEKIFLQVQSQHDPFFLLTESPSTIAKIIGRLSNLNVVLCATRELYADSLSEKQNIKLLSEQKKDAERDLLAFRHLDGFKALLDNANEKAERIQKDAALLEEYKQLIEMISSIEPKLAKEKKIKEALDSALDEALPGVLASMERLEEFNALDKASEVLDKEVADSGIGDTPEQIGAFLSKMQELQEIDEALDMIEAFEKRKEGLNLASADMLAPMYMQADKILAMQTDLETYASVEKLASEFNNSIREFKAKSNDLEIAEREFAVALATGLPAQCKTCSLLGI